MTQFRHSVRRQRSHPYMKQEHKDQLEMVRPSAAVPANVPAVPQGYQVRQFRPGDERQYDELFHLAFADEGRFPEIVERTLDGGFFVVEYTASGELVASCVALRGSTSPRTLKLDSLAGSSLTLSTPAKVWERLSRRWLQIV